MSRAVTVDRMHRDAVVAPADGLRDLPALHVDREAVEAVRHGVPLLASRLGAAPGASGPHRVLDESGDLIAVYSVEGGRTVPEVVWS